MNSFYRKAGQSLPEMAQEVRRITRLAYPTAPVDITFQLSKDCFIRAINDPKLQLSIFQRETKIIDDCIRFGVEYESFTVDLKRQHNSKPGLRKMSEAGEDDDDLIVRLAKMDDQIDKLVENRKQNSKRSITCYYCGNKGHIKRECRKHEWDQIHNCVKKANASTPSKKGVFNENQSTRSTQSAQNPNRANISHQGNV